MNILVLIKEVPDMERVKFDRERGVIDRASASGEINPLDLYALQAAVDLKNKHGGHIVAVSMGPEKSENSLRDAYARGADRCVLVTDKKFAGSDTLATSRILAAAISQMAYDLILCGEKTVDGDTAQVGAEVAELLDIPHSYYVENVDAITKKEITVITGEICGKKQSRVMKLPALMAVNKGIAKPLLPSLKKKLDSVAVNIDRVGMAEIGDLVDPAHLGTKGSPTKVSKIVIPKDVKRNGVIFRDDLKGFLSAVRGVIRRPKLEAPREDKVQAGKAAIKSDNLGAVLIIGETKGHEVHPVTYELMGKGRELADTFGCQLECLILSGSDRLVPHIAGAFYIMRAKEFEFAEECLYKANIVQFIKERKPRSVLVGATNFGRSLAPRVAAALKTGLTADCTELLAADNGGLIQIRPAFSDNILAHIISGVYPHMATVRYGEFPAPADTEEAPDIIEIPPYKTGYAGTKITAVSDSGSVDLASADVIVACGRGLKQIEDISLIQKLAEHLGGRVGFSRTLVDAGFAAADRQIGYSGIRVRPKLYIACGISGAPQHLAGMKESGTIIAINRDASAPIFGICDIGYVGDLYQVVELLTAV